MTIEDTFIKETLAKFTDECQTLEWDRYTLPDDDLIIYGWIRRSDGNRDFLLVTFRPEEWVEFTTSSAKFSERFSKLFGYSEHSSCIKYPKQ